MADCFQARRTEIPPLWWFAFVCLAACFLATSRLAAEPPSPKVTAQLMLEDARHWAEHGLFGQARSLAERARRLNVRYEPGELTPDLLLRQVEAMELGLPWPEAESPTGKIPGSPSSADEAMTPALRILERPVISEIPAPGVPRNALRNGLAPLPPDLPESSSAMHWPQGQAQQTASAVPATAAEGASPAAAPPVQAAIHRELISIPAPQVHIDAPISTSLPRSDVEISSAVVLLVGFFCGLLICLVAFGTGVPLMLRKMGPLLRIEVVYPAGLIPQAPPPAAAEARGGSAPAAGLVQQPAETAEPLFPPELLSDRRSEMEQEKQKQEQAILRHIFEQNARLRAEIARLPSDPA